MPVDLKKKKRGTAVSKNGFIHPPTHPHTCIHAYYTESEVSAPKMYRLPQPQKQVRVYFQTYLFLHPLPLLNSLGEGARRLKEKEMWNCRQ